MFSYEDKDIGRFSNLHSYLYKRQKQPLEIVCETRCSKTFFKFRRKKPMLESLFNKVGVLRAYNFIKEDSDTGVFL